MKINLGCGNKRKDGYVGIDMFACEAVDIIANVAEGIPLADGSVTEVWMDNFIEHVPDIPKLMREVGRVCAD
ncbi:MAG: methyltransferase domain-containing protein, partial [Comamonadaceae bacterium]